MFGREFHPEGGPKILHAMTKGSVHMDIQYILQQAIEQQASDIFIVSGCPLAYKINGAVTPIDSHKLMPEDTRSLISSIYVLANTRSMESYDQSGDDDFSFSIRGLGRFRCNAYKQRGSLAAVLRVMAFTLPDAEAMHIPSTITDLYKKKQGLVLITGSAGSGKSTTLACIIDKINHNYDEHIITIEDPIEYLYPHQRSIVSQREVASDTRNYLKALRAALRQAPDVILLGEMRDFETIQTAITAAETGQLVLSTLHTIGAAKTVDRIIDVFPANQQQQVRIQLSMALQAVVSQQLIPSVTGSLMPAFEVMIVDSAIRNLIREGKTHQIDNAIYAGMGSGMCTMDADILRLFREGLITKENALLYATNCELMCKKIGEL